MLLVPPASWFFNFFLLLCVFSLFLRSVNTFSLHSVSKAQLHVLCRNPKSQWCFKWPVQPKEINHVSREIYYNYKLQHFCDLGYLEPVTTNENLYRVNSFKADVTPKAVYCENIQLMTQQSINEVSKELMKGVSRSRRNTPYQARGRYRGQTQSQYLAIGNGHGRDDGKAEAHSDADSSRASVSGSTGMGQAQSQTMYDPSCDDCLGTSNLDAQNIRDRDRSPDKVISKGGRVPGIDESGPGSGSQWPGTRERGPGTGGRAPGIDSLGQDGEDQWPSTGGRVPGIDRKGPGGGGQQPGTGGRVPGIDGTGPGGGGQGPGTGGRGPGIDGTGPGVGGQWPGIRGRVPDIDGTGPGGSSQWPGTGGTVPGIEGTGPVAGRQWPGTGGRVPGIDGTGPSGDRQWPSTGERLPGIDVTGPGGSGQWPSNGGMVPAIDRTGPGGGRQGPGTGGSMPGIDVTGPGGGGQWPGTGGTRPGAGGRVPGIEGMGPGGGSQWPGTGGRAPGIVESGPGGGGQWPSTGGRLPGIDGTGPGGGGQWPGTGGRAPGIVESGPGGGGQWPSTGGRLPGIDGTGPGGGGQWPGTGGRAPGIVESGPGGGGQWPSTGGRLPGIDGTGPGGGGQWPGTGGRVPGIDGLGPGGGEQWPGTGERGPRPRSDSRILPNTIGSGPGSGGQWPGSGGRVPVIDGTGQGGPPPNYSPLYPTWQNNVTVPGTFGWPLFPGIFPKGSTYYCCVVSPGSNGQNGISNMFLNAGNLSPTFTSTNLQGPELQNQMRPNPQSGQYAPDYNTWPYSQSNVVHYSPDNNANADGSGRQHGPESRPNIETSDRQYRPQDNSGKYGTDNVRPSTQDFVGQNKPEFNARPNEQDYGGQYESNYNKRPYLKDPNSEGSSGYYKPDFQSVPNSPYFGSQYVPNVQGRPNTQSLGEQTEPGLGMDTQTSEGRYGPQSIGDKYGPYYNVQGSGQNRPKYRSDSQGFDGQYGPNFNSKPNLATLDMQNSPEYYMTPSTQTGMYGPNYNAGFNAQSSGGQSGPDKRAGPISQPSGGNYGPQTSDGQSSPDYHIGLNTQTSGTNGPQRNSGPDYNTGLSSQTYGGKYGPQSSDGQSSPDNDRGLNSQSSGGQYFPHAKIGQQDPNYVSRTISQGFSAPPGTTGGTDQFTRPDNYAQGSGNSPNSGLFTTGGPGPHKVVEPNAITSEDSDSAAEASVAQTSNGTTASASSRGGSKKGNAQTNVQGTYTGNGSFSAQAEITDENKGAQSSVEGGKKGSKSSAQGKGRDNMSQASVQLGSETGSLQTLAESNGKLHSSNSKVQGSVKGGMADAQARGPGSTSSQAQIGFTPYKEEDKSHDVLAVPFMGQGTAAAQSSSRYGQSQSNLQGKYKYGISYNGAAQAGASMDKDAVFSKRLPFNPIDVFSETDKTINVDTVIPPDILTDNLTKNGNTDKRENETLNKSESRYSANKHTHSDHHKPDSSNGTPVLDSPLGNRRSFPTRYYSNTDYEYTTEKDEVIDDFYHDGSLGPDGTGVEQTEYTNYDEDFVRESDSTHQQLLSNKRKGLDVKQTTGGNTQHIVLGSLPDHDADITQRNSERPDENRVYQPGERVPGTGGYTIPIGFTGSVKSVASKDNTYVIGSKSSPSQAQTVSLSPGTGKVRHNPPTTYGKSVDPKNLKSLYNSKKDEKNRYVSVSKSVTRDLDSENNIRKQYSHTYYTKSSSCGYFTFTCTMVSGIDGMKKVCKPKIPTNPDGTPMSC